MDTNEVIEQLRRMKQNQTFHAMSIELGIPVPTLYRWMKSGKMHRLYVEHLSEKFSKLAV